MLSLKVIAVALGLLFPCASKRRIDIVNRCSRPMIIAPTGGNSQVPCECPDGMTCSPHNECYFDFNPPGMDWTIDPGQRISLYTPNEAVQQGNGVTADWSGKIEFYANHTRDGGLIPSAFCNNMPFCPPYQGLNGVATAVEFTLVPFGPDYYDVSVINGFNVGIEMKPSNRFDAIREEVAGSQKGYNCGAAGAFHQKDGRLTSCPWQFKPTTTLMGPLLRQVDGNGTPCASDADCGNSARCGQKAVRIRNPLTGQDQPTTEIRMECGNQIGWWSAYQLCVWSGNAYVSPAPFEGIIDCPAHHQMFACAGAEPWTTTCYSPHTGSCCGCGEWQKLLSLNVPKAHEGCQGSNPVWQKHALPFLEMLKRGCPTAYTYAFDDESSTFTCQSADSRDGPEPNTAEYIITICPDQVDKLSSDAKKPALLRLEDPGTMSLLRSGTISPRPQ